MRRLFTSAEAAALGISRSTLRTGLRNGRWARLERDVYVEGGEPPSPIDRARARVLAANAPARGALAGVLHGLDGVVIDDRPTRKGAPIGPVQRLGDVPCIGGLQTLVDLAPLVDDAVWEQALESALRKRLTTIDELEQVLPALSRTRTPGTARIRRVLEQRPPGAPPTESRLETLMVQLIRDLTDLPPPVRQYEVYDSNGVFVARVDLCWPELGVFLELDGQHHLGQPAYDAKRQTAIVAATGWLPGRFTWHEVVSLRRTTARAIEVLAGQRQLIR